jgi:hypothetical protein
MLEKSERDQLDIAWRIIMVIWGAMIFTLAVYLVIAKLVEGQMKPMGVDFPLEIMTIALFPAFRSLPSSSSIISGKPC